VLNYLLIGIYVNLVQFEASGTYFQVGLTGKLDFSLINPNCATHTLL